MKKEEKNKEYGKILGTIAQVCNVEISSDTLKMYYRIFDNLFGDIK